MEEYKQLNLKLATRIERLEDDLKKKREDFRVAKDQYAVTIDRLTREAEERQVARDAAHIAHIVKLTREAEERQVARDAAHNGHIVKLTREAEERQVARDAAHNGHIVKLTREAEERQVARDAAHDAHIVKLTREAEERQAVLDAAQKTIENQSARSRSAKLLKMLMTTRCWTTFLIELIFDL